MKTKLLTAGLLAAGLMTSVAATAADSYTLGVSATVLGRCIFTQAAGATLTMTNAAGGIDPSSATSATGSANITYKCTKGQAPAFTANNGLNFLGNRRVFDGASDYMVYSLNLASGGSGSGFGATENKTLVVSGTIVQADFQNAAAGVYNDTVVINVTP